MNKIIFLLFVSLIFISLINNAPSQTSSKNEGFWIEVYQNHSPSLMSNNFISYEMIRNLPVDSALTSVKNEPVTRTWLGVNLCKLLETINISCEKIYNLSISAPDGYSSVLSGELLSALRTAICAYRVQNQKGWNEDYGYMRLIFPELRGMYWVNRPHKMVVIIGEDHQTLHHYHCYFLNNEQLSQLLKKDLKGNTYLIIDDLLVELNLPQNGFQVLTADGLFREYPGSNEINRYFILQKGADGTWEMNGINVPQGLKTRQVIFLSSGNNGVFLKALNKAEQIKWESLFWQRFVGKEFPLADLRMELILKKDQNIISELIGQFRNGEISLYQLFEKEQKNMANLDYFNLTW